MTDSRALSDYCHCAGTFACCLPALSRPSLIIRPAPPGFLPTTLVDAALGLDARSPPATADAATLSCALPSRSRFTSTRLDARLTLVSYFRTISLRLDLDIRLSAERFVSVDFPQFLVDFYKHRRPVFCVKKMQSSF
ncbi:hypothetical protein L596_018653 [Steinernema carpocapsae]|uniref:Uncharacterized protein n=1 Tax=Steinernema carpocapsae TaxID=34508 RepID=A0A4U5N596_STECR|nr:hypothetical protein L596_018650 [Steinernema carpocapsae]TKR77736.1 hypothetical protein L596_018653 [Steinernema carpocapsae]